MTYNKLVLLHEYVSRETELVNSFTNDCKVIQTNSETSLDVILRQIQSLNKDNLTHLAFVYHYPGYHSVPFLDGIKHDLSDNIIENKYQYFNNDIIDLIKNLGIELTVDLICCNLRDNDFKEEVKLIEKELNINIRYSVDQTGNNPQGNWILESDNIDIKDIYFTEEINKWNGVLNSGRNTSAIINNSGIEDYFSWDENTKTLTLLQDIDWQTFITESGWNVTDYIALSYNEIFDGNHHVIDLCGNSTGGMFGVLSNNIDNAPTIKNLGVTGGNIINNGGAILRQRQIYFIIENCYNNCYTTIECGGIIGKFSGPSTATNENYYSIIKNCYNTADIYNIRSGGIVARSCKNISVINCYNTGNIETNDVGCIIAPYCNYISIINCYNAGSTGILTNNNTIQCGGIVGTYCNYISISNCYNTGNLRSNKSSGIVTIGCNNISISNCYNTGNLNYTGNLYCAGIMLFNNSYNVVITNCYNISDDNTNIFYDYSPNLSYIHDYPITIKNCYSIESNESYNSDTYYTIDSGSHNIQDIYTNSIFSLDQIRDSNGNIRLNNNRYNEFTESILNNYEYPILKSNIGAGIVTYDDNKNLVSLNKTVDFDTLAIGLNHDSSFNYFDSSNILLFANNDNYIIVDSSDNIPTINKELLDPSNFSELGFSDDQIETYGFSLYKLKSYLDDTSQTPITISYLQDLTDASGNNLYDSIDIIMDSFTIDELEDASFDNIDIIKYGNFSIDELKDASYNDIDIISYGGFSAKELYEASYNIVDLKNLNSDSNYIYTDYDIINAGYNTEQLFDNSYSAVQIYNNSNFTIEELKTAGYNYNDIIHAGYTQIEIFNGFTISELVNDLSYNINYLLENSDGIITIDTLFNESYINSMNDLYSNGVELRLLLLTNYKLKDIIDSSYNESLDFIDYSNNTYTMNRDVNLVTEGFGNIVFNLGMDEIFDGNHHVFDFSGQDTDGLFTTDGVLTNDGTDKKYISIASVVKNLGVTGGTINRFGGGIIRSYQIYFIVENCYNNCNIHQYCGGIAGYSCGVNTGDIDTISCIIRNCYNTGRFTGGNSCGIAARCFNTIIEYCYNTSYMGVTQCSGILSMGSYYCIIRNCYNTGNMGSYSTGIVYNCGRSYSHNQKPHIYIYNCYNTGNIIGSYSSGIAGNTKFTHIHNCYNTGDIISTNSTGILVVRYCYNCEVTNCYNTGSLTATNSDIFTGIVTLSELDNSITTNPITIKNCYSIESDASYNSDESYNIDSKSPDKQDLYTNSIFSLDQISDSSGNIRLNDNGYNEFTESILNNYEYPILKSNIGAGIVTYDDNKNLVSLNKTVDFDTLAIGLNHDSSFNYFDSSNILLFANNDNYIIVDSSDNIPTINKELLDPSNFSELGFSNSQIETYGFSPYKLRNFFDYDIDELINNRETKEEIFQAGFSINELLNELDNSGVNYTRYDIIIYGNFDANDLQDASFQAQELKDASLNNEYIYKSIDIIQAGYNASQLRFAGFEAIELVDNFSLYELKDASFTVTELKYASFDASDLRDVSFTAAQLKEDFSLNLLVEASFNVTELKDASFTASDLKDVSFTAAQLKYDFSLNLLVEASFNVTELKDASFTASDLRDVSFTAAQLKNDFSLNSLIQGGYDAGDLRDASFTALDLRNDFSLNLLVQAGYGVGDLEEANFSAAQLKDVSFTALDLKNDFSLNLLVEAGYDAGELRIAEFKAKDLVKYDKFTLDKLVLANYKAGELKDASFSAIQLKTKNFTAKELKQGNFTAEDLRNASYDDYSILNAGYTIDELRNAGYTDDILEQYGIIEEVEDKVNTKYISKVLNMSLTDRSSLSLQNVKFNRVNYENVITSNSNSNSSVSSTLRATYRRTHSNKRR
jgi:uncharacterized protein YjbI with pentapeptide repeats